MDHRTKIYLFFLSLILPVLGLATHNRAGEITYRHVSGLTYEITITTYTKASSIQADRDELRLSFGDGTSSLVQRSNGIPGGNQGIPQGVIIGGDIKLNLYITSHTFAGPGTYILSMEDPNRNAGIVNIPNSIGVVFFVQTELIIPAFGQFDFNNSAILTNPPIEDGCLFNVYDHNPGAYDPDGDSLSYAFVEPLGLSGNPIFGFQQPDQIQPGTNNTISIDPITGTVTWDSPQRQGEYNIAFVIIEWRRLSDGSFIKVGEITRDMQITIGPCENDPPEIEVDEEICIEAGKTLNDNEIARDPNISEYITLKANGVP